jgi:hypothetical protein
MGMQRSGAYIREYHFYLEEPCKWDEGKMRPMVRRFRQNYTSGTRRHLRGRLPLLITARPPRTAGATPASSSPSFITEKRAGVNGDPNALLLSSLKTISLGSLHWPSLQDTPFKEFLKTKASHFDTHTKYGKNGSVCCRQQRR